MNDKVCFDKIFLILLATGCVLFYMYYNSIPKKSTECKPCHKPKRHINDNKSTIIQPPRDLLAEDAWNIRDADRRMVYDPLTLPTRRPALYHLNPHYYYDKPAVVGYVTNIKNNKVRYQLFSYKDITNRYKTNYYAFDTNTSIKFNLEPPRNVLEFFDGDKVYIDSEEYIITLYPDDFFRYNPYVV
jgi:hypothetical protein